tara:strand:+ start:171 stop:434 length:264 start_codon:yes stop_codon:yes gene_type:complete
MAQKNGTHFRRLRPYDNTKQNVFLICSNFICYYFEYILFFFSFYSTSKKWMIAMLASVNISNGMYIATLVGLMTDANINVPMDVSII